MTTTETHKCLMCGRDDFKNKASLTRHTRSEHGDSDLTELFAKYGESAPRPGGAWRTERPLQAAPSGVPSIDYAIGIGGVPKGTIVEIFGPPGSGKTLTALTFSAYAQQHGGLAGYMDAEHALQPTFAALVPNLDLDTLWYKEPKGGEEALNMTRDAIKTGAFDVWTVDSVHACVPLAMVDKDFGEATMMELARLMSGACQVLDFVIADTNTVCIFVNHVKSKPLKPGSYGKDWAKPGGSALDYYASIQLKVQPRAIFNDKDGRKIGHTVKIKVEKSKVSAPFATAEYDIFYRPGKIKKPQDPHDGMEVTPGIDIASCWLGVCEDLDLVTVSNGVWGDADTGERIGYRREIIEMLAEESPLRAQAIQQVYGQYVTDVSK